VTVVVLRPLELRDAPAIFAAVERSREALRRWMVWHDDAYDVKSAEAWVQYAVAAHTAGNSLHFSVRDADDQIVGVLSLEDISPETGRAMIGYWLATSATGRGLGTRAVREAVSWAAAHSRIRVIWSLVAEANAPSRRVLESNGFTIVGVRERDERGDIPLVYEKALP